MAFAAAQSTGFGTRGVQKACRLSWFMRLLILAGLAFLAVYSGASEQQEAAERAVEDLAPPPAAEEALTPETEPQGGSVVASEASKQQLFSPRNKYIAAGALATSLLLCLLFFFSKVRRPTVIRRRARRRGGSTQGVVCPAPIMHAYRCCAWQRWLGSGEPLSISQLHGSPARYGLGRWGLDSGADSFFLHVTIHNQMVRKQFLGWADGCGLGNVSVQ